MRRLRDLGVGVVIISHSLPDVFEVCDRVTVLRQGRTTADMAITDTDPDTVVGLMTGAIRGTVDEDATLETNGAS
jgi:simple sugar transport system ATP-binding protein